MTKQYDINNFRFVKHGIIDIRARCRHCEWKSYKKNAAISGKRHAARTLHTVDIFRENHTEYTSYVPKT